MFLLQHYYLKVSFAPGGEAYVDWAGAKSADIPPELSNQPVCVPAASAGVLCTALLRHGQHCQDSHGQVGVGVNTLIDRWVLVLILW